MKSIKANELKIGDRFSISGEGLKNRRMFTAIARKDTSKDLFIIGVCIVANKYNHTLQQKIINGNSNVVLHFNAGENDVIEKQRKGLSAADNEKLDKLIG